MKVTRVAYSQGLNAGKMAALMEQARRLAVVRSEVWQRYGSVAGARLGDLEVRDQWFSAETVAGFGLPATPWRETVRDAISNVRCNRASAKVKVKRAIGHRAPTDQVERKRLFTALKAEQWPDDPWLARQMRKHWHRGKNHTHNQIIVMASTHRTYTLREGGNVWLAVPGLVRQQKIRIPLNTTVAPSGTLRLILRDGRVEVHYQIDSADVPSSRRPCGDREIGVDKGYTEVLTDSDGVHHGPELGSLLTIAADRRRARNTGRARLRSIANNAGRSGNRGKADRINRNNLGAIKGRRRARVCRAQARNITFQAVHAVVDKASVVVAEDLTKPIVGKSRGRKANYRLARWTKGLTAEALASVSERRGSVLVHVNAAYTSQVDPTTGALGVRSGDKLHCASGVVWQADVAAAINVLKRLGDPDITLHTPYQRVKQILQERTDRQRIRLPIQDSSPDAVGGERIINELKQ